MGMQRITGVSGLGRAVPALTVTALVLMAVAGGGGAVAAAAHPGSGGAHGERPAAVAGVISTVAGGAGGPAGATNVALSKPCGVSFAGGNLDIAAGHTVRTVDPRTGRLSTPASTGVPGPARDGGLATRASLLNACGATTDGDGNLVIADGFSNGLPDSSSNRIWVVAKSTGTFYGRAMTDGHIYAVAGNGTGGFSGDGGPATGAELNDPRSVAVDNAGNLVIPDSFNSRVRVVAESSGTMYGQTMTAGDIYTVAGSGSGGFSGDGGPATRAGLAEPGGVAVDAAGNLVIADTGNERVRVVAESSGTFYGKAMTAGDIYTVAGNGQYGFSGDGGPATRAGLGSPGGVAVDAAGNLVIADTADQRVRVVAESSGTLYGKAMTAGDIYTVAGSGSGLGGFSGDGGRATSAKLNEPNSVAVDAAGNLVIADTSNYRVRVVAEGSGSFYGEAMTAGDIYTVAGNGTPGFSGDGGPATSAELYHPSGVAVDAAKNLVITDVVNDRVRVKAESTGSFYGKAMTAGDIYTVAGDGTQGFGGDGGPATGAELDLPYGVAADAAGNLVIADSFNDRIRVVAARTGTFYGRAMTAGDIYTVAGNGTPGFSGDGGAATRAELDGPYGVAVDAAGKLLIADYSSDRVREVTG